MKLNRNSKIFINYFLGPLLFIGLSWALYGQIKKQPNIETTLEGIRQSLNSPLVWNIVAVIALMFVNWSIEAIKWKIAIRPVQSVSFLKAFRAILSGVSFTVIMPNRVGEYLGRVLYMDDGNRLKTISVTIVSSISQLIITLLMGCLGWLFMQPVIEEKQLVSSPWSQVILYGMIAVIIVLTLFYFRLSWIIRWVDRLPGSKRFAYLVKVLEDFNATLLLRLLSLSALRFVVFIVQYYLLFRLFEVDISWWQAFWAVSVSFVVMAVIPSITLVEPVQRGFVMGTIVMLYNPNVIGIGFTATGIWFINLIVPAAIGSLLILGITKMKKIKNEEA
jgi:uncharacterized membrane protein YbhN (UPF0104 family)